MDDERANQQQIEKLRVGDAHSTLVLETDNKHRST
jgi:hypothetical protein